MIFRYGMVGILFCSLAAQHLPLPPLPPGAILNLNFYINNKQEFDHHGVSTTQATTGTPLFDTFAHSTYKNSFFSCITNHYWRTLGISLLIAYGVCCYYSLSGNAYLGRSDLWSSWKSDVTLEQLLAVPTATLTPTLMQEIQCRYTTSTTLNDTITPLAEFLNAIQEEEAALRFYTTFYAWASFLHAEKILFIDTQHYAHLTERLQRLAYFKNLFQAWTAQHKMEQFKNT